MRQLEGIVLNVIGIILQQNILGEYTKMLEHSVQKYLHKFVGLLHIENLC